MADFKSLRKRSHEERISDLEDYLDRYAGLLESLTGLFVVMDKIRKLIKLWGPVIAGAAIMSAAGGWKDALKIVAEHLAK